jgi:hypothetical protein
METIYITEEFKSVLSALSRGYSQDYITVYRKEGDKFYFKYGKCKLHITAAELDDYKIEG